MTIQEESALIGRVLAGDTDAFEPLVTENQNKVFHLALRLLGNEADAADAAQEAFLKAYTSLSGFRGDSRFSVWLYRLTNNVCLDMLRRQKRQSAVSLYTEDDGEEAELTLPDGGPGPEELLLRAEDARLVRAAMDALPEDLRRILSLREIGGMSYEELAATLELEPGTVKSRLNRARKKLCELLLQSGNFFAPVPSNQGKGV
ncbi:MAG: sigma-70 family RNA polymerase sigma factor [Oscillospiraceae bacterium]|nr:sigma-70 family RNA polymerase sigma factor [Oscillospiraceae bacterium]